MDPRIHPEELPFGIPTEIDILHPNWRDEDSLARRAPRAPQQLRRNVNKFKLEWVVSEFSNSHICIN